MHEDIERRQARTLVIGGGGGTTARMATRLLRVPFPILYDEDRTVYRAYGFGRAAGLIQQSGTVLIDREGVIRYVERGLNPFDALDPEALLGALDAAGTA